MHRFETMWQSLSIVKKTFSRIRKKDNEEQNRTWLTGVDTGLCYGGRFCKNDFGGDFIGVKEDSSRNIFPANNQKDIQISIQIVQNRVHACGFCIETKTN